jgi:hypothetical protein
VPIGIWHASAISQYLYPWFNISKGSFCSIGSLSINKRIWECCVGVSAS